MDKPVDPAAGFVQIAAYEKNALMETHVARAGKEMG
jgi:hypothetical protein